MKEEDNDEEKEEPEYFYRLICLVVDLGTEVLLKLFLKDIPQGQTVEAFLSSKANVLNTLKKKGVFNDIQLGIINAASPDLSCFDISLLYILISNLTNIQSPNAGWFNACPIPSDKSAGALLMNLRIVRNEAIAHRPKGKMKKTVFEKYWNDTKDILIELAGEVSQADKDSVTEEIDRIKTKQLVGDEGYKLEALHLWAIQDRNCEILSSIEELNKKIDQQGSSLGDIKSSLQTFEAQINAKIDQQGSLLGDIGPIKSSLQTFEAQINAKIDQQGCFLGDIGPIKSSLHTFEAQTNAKNDQQSIILEDIKTLVQTIVEQLKAPTDQNRQIPGTSSGTQSSEIVYARPKKRTAWKPVAKKGKSGAKLIKKSHEDKRNCVPDQEDREYVIIKDKLRTEIIDHYKVTGCCTTAVPALMDGEEVNIDEMFVMPSMRVRKNMATGTRGSSEVTKLTRQETEDVTTGSITTMHELFEKDGQSFRRICISGDAGQGKTTLCQKIVSTWCKVHGNNENKPNTEHQFLKSFNLLFYLPLRNNKLSDVIEMIKTGIVREASHNALKQVLEKESENCLIILDGLDEWLPSDDCKRKVPYIDPREKFTVLITSRPWKLEVLRPKMHEIGREVELNGIKNDKLIEAVVNILNNKYAKNRNWKSFKYAADSDYCLNETYRKVKHLVDVPIILTQMVCMWYDDEEFGNTRVKIYSKMLDYLFNVADTRHQEMLDSAWMGPKRSNNKQLNDVFKCFTFCHMHTEILFKLSDLAYHTLFNEERENSLVFPHSVTEIYKLAENDVKFCLLVGILSQTKHLSKASSYTKTISFLHKTFQEFLAALYISFGGNDGSFIVMLQTLKHLDDVFEMSQVLIFLSGLRPDLIGDISRHIAQLTDKDERVLQYRSSIRYEHDDIIVRTQKIIYNCIVEVPKPSVLENEVELRDFDLFDIGFALPDMAFEDIISYVNFKGIKSYDEQFVKDIDKRIQMNDSDLVKLCVFIRSQEDMDWVTSTVESCCSSLTCLSVLIYEDEERNLMNMNNFLTALPKVNHLTCVELKSQFLTYMNLTHSDIEYLGEILSESTQLKEIRLLCIRCSTCQHGQCNYSINLSHHKQLQYVGIEKLDGDIVLSNEVPVKYCEIRNVKCAVSILDRLKFSTSLQELELFDDYDYMDDDDDRDNDNDRYDDTDDDIPLHHINSITSSTTTVQDAGREVHPTPLCLSKVVTDVIPTLTNLRTLKLLNICFKQDILRLSPEMTSLKNVVILHGTMTLQYLQGFIDSLPQTQFSVMIKSVSICPKKDLSTALEYVTNRHQLIEFYNSNEVGFLNVKFINRPPH